MTYGIYKLWFPNDPKQVYIGKSENIEARYKGHCNALAKGTHPNRKMQQAYKGIKIVGKIEQALDYDPTFLAIKENFYIVQYDSVANGLNQNYGSSAIRYEGGNQRENDQVRQAFVLMMNKVDDTDICIQTGLTPKMLQGIRQGKLFTWLQAEFPTEYKQRMITKQGNPYHKGSWDQVLQARQLWVH